MKRALIFGTVAAAAVVMLGAGGVQASRPTQPRQRNVGALRDRRGRRLDHRVAGDPVNLDSRHDHIELERLGAVGVEHHRAGSRT